MKNEKTETERMRRAADRLERKLARLKASHVRAEDVARRLVAIEDLGGRRLADALVAAAPSLAECTTEQAHAEILAAVIKPLLAELDRLRAEALPTLPEPQKRGLN